ncbi:gamma-glutamyl-gamma-aminobutyrate hydrolase family protein [uncultured Gulosibacter sp.]|uniref:gamma-glutamyl-gamma-aminobutyrate hydrolase family protein n=1 Tax=uncultured Gulosibacter sp. TaxID=1339167 RepID=UPI00288C348B|nr:gamma-glutamyl-gamma-aminobutyrate hydrolase family protein [uncultured Gulosibacter sp.]
MVAEQKPLIAVPAMSSSKIQGLRYSGTVVANAVLDAIARAGGQPIVFSPHHPFSAWDEIDGLVVPGGADVNPARYGAIADEHDWATDFDQQDDADAAAISAAETRGIPALLICRGLQLWNVERGGTLIQHLPEEPINHVGSEHGVAIKPTSRLAAALEGLTEVEVSSYHHQAIGELGKGLRVVGRSTDGTVEAVEDLDLDIVAVQWHPEDRANRLAVDQQLFDWVVARARARREGR